MKSFAMIAAATLAGAIAIGGCRPAGTGDEDSGPIDAVPPTMTVAGARVSIAPMQNELRLLGVTAARRHITLRAPTAGRVIEIDFNSGDRVRRGEVVARIINRESEAAQAGLAVARRLDPEHASELEKSVDRHAGNAAIAVTAPEDAIVAQRLVSGGQMVAELDPLADLIDPASIFVDAAVPIDSVRLVRPGMEAIVTSQIRPGAEFHARVAAVSPAFDPGSATTPARLEFIGEPRIDQAGAAAEVRVVTESWPGAIVVPAAALFQDAEHGGFYVFVAGADGLAHRTPVEIGVHDPGRVQITRGLAAGQVVITSGGYALSDGLRVSVAIAQN
ncbi:MAG: efflux RND transporter periplasmic adaptor subunit [Candidatus Binatales bacterium]